MVWRLRCRRRLCGHRRPPAFPGTVGARRLQDVGAYGRVPDHLTVRAFDRSRRRLWNFPRGLWYFPYQSRNLHRVKERYIRHPVDYALSRELRPPPPRLSDLARYLLPGTRRRHPWPRGFWMRCAPSRPQKGILLVAGIRQPGAEAFSRIRLSRVPCSIRLAQELVSKACIPAYPARDGGSELSAAG